MKRQKSALRLVVEPLLIAVALAFAVRATLRFYTIPSSSMAPTLEAGDHIVVTPYRGQTPGRGDVIVFRAPAPAQGLVVKRVIALPGDLVEGDGGHVRISGRQIEERYAVAPATASSAIAPQVIPAGCLFVMGDNRAESFDSRHWGVLPAANVLGRARLILWSSGDGSGGALHAASPRRDDLPAPRRLGRIFKWID